MQGRRLLLLLALLAGALLVPAAAEARAPVPAGLGPAGDAFYTPPANSTARQHGDIVWARPFTGTAALKSAASNTLVLYRGTSLAGRRIATSGIVSVPRGTPPKRGWPLISYAHGSTGIADSCAPSRDTPDSPVHGYHAYAYPTLERLVRAGYAVVRTDYEGLGTPGDHPYLVGRSEGRAVLDMALAARRLNPAIGRNLVVAGHSQGGQAALWAGALARAWTPGLRLRGTLAWAPVSHLEEQGRALRSLKDPGLGLTGLIAIAVRGTDIVRRDLDATTILTDRARALYPQTLTTCLPQLGRDDSFGALAPADLPRDDADLTPFLRAIGESDPEQLTLRRAPVFVAQGTADRTVFKLFTDPLVDELRARGANVTYRTYEGVQHSPVVAASLRDALAWLTTRLG